MKRLNIVDPKIEYISPNIPPEKHELVGNIRNPLRKKSWDEIPRVNDEDYYEEDLHHHYKTVKDHHIKMASEHHHSDLKNR
jgi:hypothetical protein